MNGQDLNGLAEILLHRFQTLYPDMELMIDQDVESVAQYLESIFEPEIINEFITTELGYGVMLGMIAATNTIEREAMEPEYEEEEGDDNDFSSNPY